MRNIKVSSARAKRLMIGILEPVFFGVITFSIVTSFIQVFPLKGLYEVFVFIARSVLSTVVCMPFAYIILGVPSIVYSFLMEFLVLKYIKNIYLSVFISILLCLAFPFWIEIFLSPWDKAYIMFHSCGGFAGGIVGVILYNDYHKQHD